MLKISNLRLASHSDSIVNEKPIYSCKREDFKLKKIIGHGSSSVVFEATNCNTPNRSTCAVKVIELDKFELNIANIRRETHIMSLSKHQNVLPILDCWIEGSKLHLVSKLMKAGSALDILQNSYPEGIEEIAIATILKQALQGLHYLHNSGWLHRDIKASNLLIEEDGTVLLADFGVGTILEEGEKINVKEQDNSKLKRRRSFVGTPFWMAPEVLEDQRYDQKADIWSFAITSIELATGKHPNSDKNPVKAMMEILKGNYPTLHRFNGPNKYSQSFVDMIESCLQKDPNKRPTAARLLKHSFFNKAKSKSVLKKLIIGCSKNRNEKFTFTLPSNNLAKSFQCIPWDFDSDATIVSQDTNAKKMIS